MSKLWIALSLLFLVFTGCKDTGINPYIPDVPVNIQINVSSLQYPELRQDGGYVYLEGGYKGILLVRQNANLYTAFERACPYDPTAPCSQVQVDQSNLFIVDTCCGSQFSLQGTVMAGPAAYGLKQYQTTMSGSILYILH